MKKWIFFLLVFGAFLTSSSACKKPKAKDQMEHRDDDGHGHEHKDGDGHEHIEGDNHEHKEGDDHNH